MQPPAPGPAAPRGRLTPIAIALAVVLALFLLVWVRYQPPAVRPASAPPAQFSAVRAETVLKRLLGNQRPHPVGSPADAAVRTAVLAELVRLGYQPRVEPGFACSGDGVCGRVENVLARLDGAQGGPAVLLASHYDSVPAGPGASDDGAGVAAALEIARALKAGPPPRHPVIFLFDEGEEAGMLGAVAFVEQSRGARQVAAAVNLEARGTSGPSLMFETGGHSVWSMPLFARAVRRPLANSLYYAVYRRLPNDTDFSIFSRHGFDGFNFAFIGGVSHYHTPLDDLAHLDPRSLQSQGDNALAAVRALANAPLASRGGGQAVFFDVAAWQMLWWPVGWTIPLAALALLLVAACVWWLLHQRLLTPRALARGLAVWPAAVALAALLALALRWLLGVVGAVPGGWVAHPVPLVPAFWLLGVAAAFAVAFGLARLWARRPPESAAVPPRLARRREFWGLWCATWLWFALLGLIVALVLPQGSFLWLAPALLAGMCGIAALLFGARGWRANAAAIVPMAVAALLTFQLALLIYPALGAPSLLIVAVLLASFAVTLVPLFSIAPAVARRVAASDTAAAVVILALIAAFLPPYTPQSPQRMNFVFAADLSKFVAGTELTTQIGKLPPELAKKHAGLRPSEIFPWSLARGFYLGGGKVKDLYVAGPNSPFNHLPSLAIDSRSVAGNRVTVRARLDANGARVVSILFPPRVKVDSFEMEGHPVPPLSARALRAANGWHRYVCVTAAGSPAGKGVAVSFTVEGPPRFDAIVLSQSPWLPSGKLPPGRPAWAVPSQAGDVDVMFDRVPLGSAVHRAPLPNNPALRP